MRLEAFFDCSSPWTYLAFERIQPLAAKFGAKIEWRPILVGGIFNAVNPGVEFFKRIESTPKLKIDYMLKDMADWAREADIRIKFPPSGPSGRQRENHEGLSGAPRANIVPFARAAFQAYF